MRLYPAVRFLFYAAAFSMLAACSSHSVPEPNPLVYNQEEEAQPHVAPLNSRDSSIALGPSVPEVSIANPERVQEATPVPKALPVVPKPSESNASPVPKPSITKKSALPKQTINNSKPSTSIKTAPEQKTTAVLQKQLSLAELARKYPDQLLLHGAVSKKQAALTFDDAPDSKFTPQVLDILKKYKVRATFFLVGSQVEKHPDIVRRIMREGHVIGNHSYSHKLFTKLSDESFQAQLLQTQGAIKALTGYAPRLVRPPYGEIKESQLLWASSQGYLVVNWNVDSLDWKQLNESQVFSNIVNHTRNGSIILQHSGGGPSQDLSGTIRALPQVIEKLQGRGYRLVTLPELLHVQKEKK